MIMSSFFFAEVFLHGPWTIKDKQHGTKCSTLTALALSIGRFQRTWRKYRDGRERPGCDVKGSVSPWCVYNKLVSLGSSNVYCLQ